MSLFNKYKNLSLKNIYFCYVDDSSYGLRILFEFISNEYLFFDSSGFSFIKQLGEYKSYRWNKIEYPKLTLTDIYIQDIRQDEITNFFIKFSNDDVFNIYQRIFDLEHWSQNFQLVTIDDQMRYKEILAHMNEDWIGESIIKYR